MPAQLIDGKKLSELIREDIAREVKSLHARQGLLAGLAVILVGDDEASKVYVRNKEAACHKAGMFAVQHTLPADTTEAALLRLIGELNQDPKIHGILVQLPLPKHIREAVLLEAIDPAKDADGFHPTNMGYLLMGRPTVIPCTPFGLMKMLDSIGAVIEGKEAVVVGRSNIVGKPAALLLMQRHATVTMCHSKTAHLDRKVAQADILVAALGKPQAIRGEWIKPGAIVLDVGINRLPNGKLAGDVDFESAKERASYITPVPGGVGPMTIAMLLYNTLENAKRLLERRLP